MEQILKVKNINRLNEKIQHITLKPKHGEILPFKAGQYLKLEIPVYEGSPEAVIREYSIASSPNNRDEIHLILEYIEDGIASTYFKYHMKEGDTLKVNYPYGDAYLRESDRDIIMASIGSGIAPLLSILTFMKEEKITDRKVYFFHSAYRPKDFIMLDECNELKKDLPLTLFFSANEALLEDNWQGLTGFVQEEIKTHFDDLSNYDAYLCGSPDMVMDTEKVLLRLNIPKKQVYYDSV